MALCRAVLELVLSLRFKLLSADTRDCIIWNEKLLQLSTRVLCSFCSSMKKQEHCKGHRIRPSWGPRLVYYSFCWVLNASLHVQLSARKVPYLQLSAIIQCMWYPHSHPTPCPLHPWSLISPIKTLVNLTFRML